VAFVPLRMHPGKVVFVMVMIWVAALVLKSKGPVETTEHTVDLLPDECLSTLALLYYCGSDQDVSQPVGQSLIANPIYRNLAKL
jgi:hypothetical protein